MKRALLSIFAAVSFIANAQKDISVSAILPVDGYEYTTTVDTNIFAFEVTNTGTTTLTATDTVFYRMHIDSIPLDGQGYFYPAFRPEGTTPGVQSDLAPDSSFVYAFYYSDPFPQTLIDALTNHVVCYDVLLWDAVGQVTETDMDNNNSCTEGLNSVGVNEIANNTYSVYPNPVVNELNIDLTADKGLLSVFDMTGRQMTSAYLTEGTNTVNVSALAAGNYMFVITNEGSFLGSGKFQK